MNVCVYVCVCVCDCVCVCVTVCVGVGVGVAYHFSERMVVTAARNASGVCGVGEADGEEEGGSGRTPLGET